MSTTETPTKREQIRNWIADRVKTNWAATGKALLLSRLGLELRSIFADVQKVIPEGLKEFLLKYPVAKVVIHPIVHEKIGLVPMNAEIPKAIDTLFSDASSTAPTKLPVRYFPQFWRAFYTPLTERRRFVIPPSRENPSPIIKEAEDLTANEVKYEILPSDVVTLPAETPLIEKIAAVRQSIQAWLARNSLSEHIFVDHAYKSALSTNSIPRPATSSTEFADALARLGPSELARIFVPLDLVQRLLSERP